MTTITQKIGQLIALLCLSTSFLQGNVSEENFATPVGLYINIEELASDEEVQIQERAYRDPYYPIDYSSFSITTIGHQGNTVSISDGSLWTIRPNDGWIVSGWNDLYNNSGYGSGPSKIYLTTNNNWLFNSSYPYVMVNINTGESVYCNISATAPLANCIWIQYIDYYNGRIELAHANGFNVFYLCGFDNSIYADWHVGDRVFYGRNSQWNNTSNPYLLINFETSTNARCDL